MDERALMALEYLVERGCCKRTDINFLLVEDLCRDGYAVIQRLPDGDMLSPTAQGTLTIRKSLARPWEF